jgi:cobalt/nickel-transporting P-type ATPase D
MPPLLSAIANAGRHGVLVKSAVAMERLADVDAVALDKTGTLTRGTPHLVSLQTMGHTEHDALRWAAAAEQYSEHPIGRAVVSAARDRGYDIVPAHDFEALTGRGVRAQVEGHLIEVHTSADSHGDDGATVVTLLRDGHPIAELSLVDELRDDAATTVATLATLTRRSPVLITGDNAGAATALAQRAGICEVRAGLLPHQKAETVRTLQDEGSRVLVVGDGINDAPAMAAAHSSVAMGRTGSDLALETADAVTVRDELVVIPTVVTLARRARRVVIANLVIAATVIAALVTWDLVGHLPLPLGVAGHEGSTILVALNGLRLLTDRAWRRAGQVSSAIPCRS